MYIFPVRHKGANELKYIFPSKQRAVQKAIELAESDSRINKIIIFGSAVTRQCGIFSDVDIALITDKLDDDEFDAVAGPFFKEVPSELDIVDYNNISSKLLKKEIDENGVCVYVRQ